MNLGGIMVSSLDLERIIGGHPAVYESAAVAVQPEGEGAVRLVVFVVSDAGGGPAGSPVDVGTSRSLISQTDASHTPPPPTHRKPRHTLQTRRICLHQKEKRHL